jgi:hypothetical protein
VNWYCLDCMTAAPLDKHGRCSTCGSDAVTDTEGRSVIDLVDLARMEHQLKWLAWAEKAIEEAHAKRR